MDRLELLVRPMVAKLLSKTSIGKLRHRTFYVVKWLDTGKLVHSPEPLQSEDAPMERPREAIA